MARCVDLFNGPVEVDETSMGGKERNKNAKKNEHAGRCTVGKTVVAGSRDRDTSRVTAVVVSDTKTQTLQDFVIVNTGPGAEVYHEMQPPTVTCPSIMPRSSTASTST